MTATTAAAWTVAPSPVGDLLLTTDGRALTGVLFTPHRGVDSTARLAPAARDDGHEVLTRAAEQLAEYFDRSRTAFDLPLAPVGSRFQQRVWEQLRAIPYGQTCSYGDVARRLGLLPSASRAVGMANGSNPISIIVPCHRVVGSNGSLTGYAGGLDRKRTLLDLERGSLF